MVAWTAVRKSSYSAGKDNCVGIARSLDGSAVRIVDTKDPEGVGIVVSASTARRLLAGVGKLGPV
jgi:uncharacterized protein DUF397